MRRVLSSVFGFLSVLVLIGCVAEGTSTGDFTFTDASEPSAKAAFDWNVDFDKVLGETSIKLFRQEKKEDPQVLVLALQKFKITPETAENEKYSQYFEKETMERIFKIIRTKNLIQSLANSSYELEAQIEEVEEIRYRTGYNLVRSQVNIDTTLYKDGKILGTYVDVVINKEKKVSTTPAPEWNENDVGSGKYRINWPPRPKK